MKWKLVKCFLTGGCKFDAEHTESHYDPKTDMQTIKQVCINCGETYVYKFNRTALNKYAERIHEEMTKRNL